MSDTNKPADPALAPRKRRARSPSVAKPAFIIVQVLDESGNPQPFDKKRLRVVSVERSAEKVMEAMENGTHDNAFYLRVIVPATAVQRPGQTRPVAVPTAA